MVRLSDSLVLRERAQPCSLKRKIKFGTEQEARQNLSCLLALIAVNPRIAVKYWDPRTLNVYQCEHCGHWHIGHTQFRQKGTDPQESGCCTHR